MRGLMRRLTRLFRHETPPQTLRLIDRSWEVIEQREREERRSLRAARERIARIEDDLRLLDRRRAERKPNS